jgi:ParB family transcriptional regulator, chromosome partitioning protein
MARKRLTPVDPDHLQTAAPPALPSGQAPRPGSLARAPIAQIAAEAAGLGALAEISDAWAEAQEQGRMVLSLPLDAIDPAYLIRDRVGLEPEAMAILCQSLRARGQQTPIEVTALPADPVTGAARYGLISGWRRLTALQLLHYETGEARFARVLALMRQPAASSDAYVAMVEENEIRAGLSFYERARIVVRALQAGIFETEKAALQSLFSTALPAKRSKVKSFIPIVAQLDEALQFPARLSEKLGLTLARTLQVDPEVGRMLRDRLLKAPSVSAEEEVAMIEVAIRGRRTAATKSVHELRDAMALLRKVPMSAPKAVRADISISHRPGRAVLTGDGVDPVLLNRLIYWLSTKD